MRIFIAIEVSEEAAKELKRVQEKLEQKGVRFPDKYHLTLKFLGDLEEDRIESSIKNLEKIEFKQFELSLADLDVIQPDFIRVVHANVKPLAELLKLGELVDNATAGVSRDHMFKPHITVARVKFVEDKKEFIEKVKSIKLNPIAFKVKKFELLKSTLTKEGPIHEIIKSFPLS